MLSDLSHSVREMTRTLFTPSELPTTVRTMDATPLRPAGPARFRRAASPRAMEALLTEISTLVVERQRLRARGASSLRLERNRLRIARSQWELSYSLILRYRAEAA